MPKPKEGTIIHRKNSLYEARIMLDGKQVYVGASKYYKEAFRKLEAARKLKQPGFNCQPVRTGAAPFKQHIVPPHAGQQLHCANSLQPSFGVTAKRRETIPPHRHSGTPAASLTYSAG